VCPALSYDSSTNHLTFIGGVPVTYDAAGNQSNDQFFAYQYDAEGRVTYSASTGQWQYPMYNALGQRVEDYQGTATDSLTLTYPRDIFGQRTGAFAQWPSQNWTGWNVFWSQVAGQRLNMGGASAYIDHADAVGSTTMETDPAGGVQWKIAYYPWGQVLAQGGTRQSVVWAGLDWQINDPSIPSATREYNDGLGRWLTPDPDNVGSDVSDSQSWNMYGYVGDNPISRNDPTGEDYYLLGGEACGTNYVVCDKQGYVLGSNSQRQIVTDQQVLSGAVGATVGENGVSTITTSQGTFQAQFFDTSPSTYEVSGQPGSLLAAVGANFGIGVWNQAADIANTFMTQLTVGQYSLNMPNVPTGSGAAANVGAVAALLGVAMTGPGGEVREDMKASEILARYVKGRVKEEFPSQFLDRTLAEIRLAARQRVPFAQKALKLLTRIEYRK
jgi:RHS repeat-associated protein